MEMQESLIPEQPQQTIKSPYLSIWFHPRKTIRHILDTDPNKHVTLIAMLLGILKALDVISDQNSGDYLSLGIILGAALLLGIIIGPIRLFIYALVFQWVGTWFKGKAIFIEVKAAYAWSSLPNLIGLPIWVIMLMLYGKECFTTATPFMDSHLLLSLLALPLFGIMVIMGLWRTVLLIINLAEVHQFSIWKAIATYVLPYIIVGIPTFLILMVTMEY